MRSVALARGLMAASGFAGLGYQVVWTQQCALWLGHETAAVMAIVAAFFGGLALGAWALSARIARSARPARWYALCEATIGLWGLLLIPLLPATGAWLQAQQGLAPAGLLPEVAAFGAWWLLLLPATAAMGATLPAMQGMLAARDAAAPGQHWAGLYAANTAGAVAGALGAALLLVPVWGLAHTAAACAALNLLVAVGAWWCFFRDRAAAPVQPPPTPAGVHDHSLLAVLGLTGLLGIGYELLVVRVLSQVTEDTVYTFAMLLAVYLAGTAAGAEAYRRWGPNTLADGGQRCTQRLGGALAGACLLGAASLWGAEATRDAVARGLQPLAGDLPAALLAEAALALLAFAPATVVMGALFSHLCRCAIAQGVDAGRCLAVNTLGAALAAPLVGLLLLPAWGAKAGLLLLACGYAALGWRRPASPWTWAPLAGAGLAAAFAPPLVFVTQPEDGRLLAYDEGVSAAVSVVADGQGVARLYINNRQQEGSSASWRVDGRQALLPLLLHPGPHQALFLGLGTGVTAVTATLDPALQVQAVELLPEVIAMSPRFTAPLARAGTDASRLQLQAADARRFVRVAEANYDVIVADNFHPARSGSGALYTVAHFQAVRARLAEGGLFCQWLPLHQLDLASLASITASFQAAFPQARLVLASNSLATPVLGLVGATSAALWRPAQVQQRLDRLPAAAGFGFEDPMAVLGSFVASPEALRQWAQAAPLNTDDRPVVSYSAPRLTYAPDSPPAQRLMTLLQQLDPAPPSLLDPRDRSDWAPRLAAYGAARQHFIAAGRAVQPLADPRAMLARVREPLLAVLRESPDFRPAYDPLWQLARAVAPHDGATARAVLGELARLQPARTEAPAQLQALGATP